MTDHNVTSVDSIAAAIAQADKELAEELSKEAVRLIKQKKSQIVQAKKIVSNLELELEALVRDLRAKAGL